MGKIANALDKYARERKNSGIPRLTRADQEVLLAYDRKTCYLLNYPSNDGQMNQQSSEALTNRGTIQRLLVNKLIYQRCSIRDWIDKPVPDWMIEKILENIKKDKTTEQSQIMRAKEDACLSLLTEVPRGTFSS